MNQHVEPPVATEAKPFFSLKLQTPFTAYADKIETLVLQRGPTVDDIMRCGMPFVYNLFVEPPAIGIREAPANMMLERIAGLPGSSLAKMAATDWIETISAIVGAIIPDRALVSELVSEKSCTLTKAIGENITTVTFKREPTGADILKHGLPVVIGAEGPDFNEVKAARMLAALTDIPFDAIRQMDPGDFHACLWGMIPFFAQRTAEGRN
jgi:hypothetical protein